MSRGKKKKKVITLSLARQLLLLPPPDEYRNSPARRRPGRFRGLRFQPDSRDTDGYNNNGPEGRYRRYLSSNILPEFDFRFVFLLSPYRRAIRKNAGVGGSVGFIDISVFQKRNIRNYSKLLGRYSTPTIHSSFPE